MGRSGGLTKNCDRVKELAIIRLLKGWYGFPRGILVVLFRHYPGGRHRYSQGHKINSADHLTSTKFYKTSPLLRFLLLCCSWRSQLA
jgi:hypothetical protein